MTSAKKVSCGIPLTVLQSPAQSFINLKFVCTSQVSFYHTEKTQFLFNIIIIITIIIDRQLGLDRPVSASCNSPFNGLPSRLRPFGLQFSSNSAILLLFILVTCCSQFVLYLLSFSLAGSTFISSKICSFLLLSKGLSPLFFYTISFLIYI